MEGYVGILKGHSLKLW